MCVGEAQMRGGGGWPTGVLVLSASLCNSRSDESKTRGLGKRRDPIPASSVSPIPAVRLLSQPLQPQAPFTLRVDKNIELLQLSRSEGSLFLQLTSGIAVKVRNRTFSLEQLYAFIHLRVWPERVGFRQQVHI
jgi:hypothetical protein